MAANGSIAVAKFVGFGVTGSASMLAEAIHSVADTSNQGLLLWGGKAAQKEADSEHQFGYGRERYFWSFVVALVLFTLGGGYATYEGINKIRHPHEIDNLPVAIGILLFGILVEGLSFRLAVVEARENQSQRHRLVAVHSSLAQPGTARGSAGRFRRSPGFGVRSVRSRHGRRHRQ